VFKGGDTGINEVGEKGCTYQESGAPRNPGIDDCDRRVERVHLSKKLLGNIVNNN